MAQVLYNVRALRSFAACESYYAEAHQWGAVVGRDEVRSKRTGEVIDPGFKAHPAGSRALDHVNHKRYLSIRPVLNEHGDTTGYACRYRSTDVVVWSRGPEGETVRVKGWGSLSTAVMAEALTPQHFRFKLDLPNDDYYAIVKDRVYAFHDTITFAEANDWLPVNHQYKATFLDAASPTLANALARTRYKDFAAWLNAVLSFDQRPVTYANNRDAASAADDHIGEHGILATLQDPSKWAHLKNFTDWVDTAQPESVYARADRIKLELREHIYREYKAAPTRKVEWYDASQFDRQRQLRLRYAWAI